jgi:hypothetical protein
MNNIQDGFFKGIYVIFMLKKVLLVLDLFVKFFL